MMAEVSEKDIDEAIGRLALTRDGMLLYRRLLRVALSIAPLSEGGGALPLHEGRRRFALELKSLMDANAQSAISDRSDAESDTVSLAARVGPGRSSVAAGGERGVRRRVEPYPAPAQSGG